MKRFVLIVLIAALLAAAVSALAEADGFSAFDYVQGETVNGNYLTFTFPDIALLIPMEWRDRLVVEQGDDGVSFYHAASREKYLEEGLEGGGFLFELCASADEADIAELPASAYLGYSENAGLHFYLLLPSDYPAWPDAPARAEYDAMAAQIDLVVEKARIAPSLNFYPGESTDAGMS